jgi:hypothetical protein
MRNLSGLKRCALLVTALALTACANPTQRQPYDYTALRQSRPRSIVVLPPLNNTPEVRAPLSMLAQVTRPLAESGYYVLPVALVQETFRENGLEQAADAQAVPSAKLREIFGADAGLYITMTQYGTRYQVFDSVTTVAAQAKLVDLRTDQVLWSGSASASTAEQKNQQQGLAAQLLTALIKQVVGTVVDHSHPMAGLASERLLAAGRPDGLLHGPRSPKHEAAMQPAQP